ncbi:MAG: tetratricopeptide repeat protein [Proteobacteria bacterium]|nr:tetratricopeptide repeat protein [Pseudomonadota bacterium]
MRRGFARLLIGAMAAAFMMTGTVALAQDVSFAEKKEARIASGEAPKKVERKTLDQEEGAGPKVDFETDEMAAEALAAEKIELQQAAIKKLQVRIKQTDEDDVDKPKLMERLGDMLWQKARFYESRAYDSLNAANEAGAAGNTAKQTELMAKKAEDEKTSREARDEMLKLYKEIIKYHPEYESIDKIRYYMAFNLAEMGYAGEAYAQYSDIVREHTNSKYLPEAFLGMAEYTFTIEEDMPTALQQYQKVVNIDPKSSAASFAMYKMGWCYFNLGEPKKALAQFEKVIRDSEGTSSTRRGDMRKEAMKDLVKAYSLWEDAKPANARKYFKGFAANEEEVDSMMERLARLYQENGKVEESNYVYNSLIAANPKKFKIVGYQREIMMNVETMSDPKRLAEEVQRSVLIFVKARDEKYEGATPEAVKAENDKLQAYASDTGKWYHITYQNTKNPLYYSLAFEIYKTYLDNFPDAKDNFEVMYYYADMAYFRKNYAEAARGYERVLDLNDKGLVAKSEEHDEMLKDAAHGAVLAYDFLMSSSNTDTEACPPIPETPEAAEGEEQTFPEYPVAECRLKFIEASKRYAKIDTSAEFAQSAKFKGAEIYFNYNHFEEARPLFLELTHEAPDTEVAVYSANYLLETYRLTKQYEAMREALKDLKSNSAFMANKTEYMPKLIEAMNIYEEALDYKICEEKNANKQYEDAARCYEEFAVNHKGSEDAAKARWNASVAWEQTSEVGRAIDARVALLTSNGADESTKALAPRAMYAIGQNYHGLAVYSEAARFYEMFVKQFPDDREACVPFGAAPKDEPCAKDALSNAAAFRAGLGEYEKAVEDYDLYAKMFPKDKAQMAALKFATGRIYYDQKKYDSALDRFRDFMNNYAKFGSPGLKVVANTYIGKTYWAKKNQKEALKYFETAENLYNSKDLQKWLSTAAQGESDQARNAAAEARFMRGETLFQDVLDVKLQDSSVKGKKVNEFLQQQLLKKAEKLQVATPVYNDVISKFNAPKWGLAAMTRLGMMYDDVAQQIEKAPTPPGLPIEVELEYVDQLLEFSSKFEEAAIGYYVAAVKKAADTGWFSQYTSEAQRRLFDLRPMEYRSAAEVKATPNKMVSTYHNGALYTDLEELRGHGKVDKRQVVEDTLSDDSAAAGGSAE